MGGARALIASLGASISLVAGAALSLLVVSFVFAYDGLTGAVDAPASQAALILEKTTPAPAARGRVRRGNAVVVISTAARATPSAPRRAAEPRLTTRVGGAQSSQPSFRPGVRDLGPSRSAPTTTRPGTGALTGDGVRELGGAVSATVDGTTDAAGSATAPLGPPVSQAVQDVLDLLSSVVQGATGGLAGTLDKVLPAPRR
jgi:hypothetical protein